MIGLLSLLSVYFWFIYYFVRHVFQIDEAVISSYQLFDCTGLWLAHFYLYILVSFTVLSILYFRLIKLPLTLIALGYSRLTLTCICIVSIMYFRLIKLSSPRINSLIALGCGLSYLDILFFGLDSLGVERKTWMCGVTSFIISHSDNLFYFC